MPHHDLFPSRFLLASSLQKKRVRAQTVSTSTYVRVISGIVLMAASLVLVTFFVDTSLLSVSSAAFPLAVTGQQMALVGCTPTSFPSLLPTSRLSP